MVAMNYATRIVAQYAQELALPAVIANLTRVDFRPRIWYNPELRSRNYNVPGVIALIIMLICLMLTSMAIVREREVGTMEQLMVTPIRPVELILGKTIPFALISFFDMALVTCVGVLWFKIPIKGAFSLLVFGTSLYLLSVLGIGLFISTVTHNQQQAMMATMLFDMPAILLSGLCFPSRICRRVFQYLTYLNPLQIFSGHHQRRVFERQRFYHSLAANGRVIRAGPRHHHHQFLAIQKTPGIRAYPNNPCEDCVYRNSGVFG